MAVTQQMSSQPWSSHNRCHHTTVVVTQQVPSHNRCCHTTGAITQQVPSHNRCHHTTGVVTQQVPSHNRCHHTTVVVTQQVLSHNRCHHTTGAVTQQVPSHNCGCHTTGAVTHADSQQPLNTAAAPVLPTSEDHAHLLTTHPLHLPGKCFPSVAGVVPVDEEEESPSGLGRPRSVSDA